MANQFLKLRRSAVPGRIPSTSSLDFGEIALNTYDGLAFLKKSGSNGEEIVAIGANTISITGSANYIPLFSGTSSLITSSIYQTGSFTGINATAPDDFNNVDVLLVNGRNLPTYNILSAHGEINSYAQLNVQNFNGGGLASSDIVATADNGTELTNYIDLGINSSGYSIANSVGFAGDAYLYSSANDLYIGNTTPGKQVILFNGGLDSLANGRVWIHDQGTVGINTGAYDILNPPSLQISSLSTLTYNLVVAESTVDNYSQINLINNSSGTSASADIVATNDTGNESSGYINMGINSTTYNVADFVGGPGDGYLYSIGNHLHIGNASPNQPVMFFAGGLNADEHQKLILYPNNQHEMTGSLNMSGSLTVGGTITAQTLIVQTITSSTDFVTGSTIFGSQLSNTHQFTGSVSITGSLNAPIITGSLFGTASWAQNAVTASYVAAANVAGLSLFQITTGSITASVGLGNNLFLIKSGSKTYFNISSSGDTTIYSSNFMIRDFNTNEMVFQVSASRAYFDFDGITIATQSVAPTGSADVGGILFTSTAMYIGLE